MRNFLIPILLYLAYAVFKVPLGNFLKSNQEKKKEAAGRQKMVQDPICEIYIPIDRAIEKTGGLGPVYFCSEKCAEIYLEKA